MLRLCLRSLESHSSLPHQIVLHINQGDDGTLEWARSRERLAFTASPVNTGVSHALNAARSLARAQYLVFFNDDMYACPGWDTALWKEIERIGHNRFMLSSTMIEPRDTGNPCVIVADHGKTLEEFREEELLREFPLPGKEDWQGSTWPPNLLHRDLWDLVGGMSTEYFPGFYSDPDLSMKLWNTGVRLFKGLGASRVYHFGSRTTSRVKHRSGRRTFAGKWGMTSGVFTRHYLRRGTPWNGPLPEPEQPLLARLRNLLESKL